MRINVDIDEELLSAAHKISGQPTKKKTIEEALRLLIRLRKQKLMDAALGSYRWRGNLACSRQGRGVE
jgi:Arc/MetJ family transcription regulator